MARVTLLAYMFPPIIMLVPLFLLARELGLVNSLPGLALTYISFSLPYALWILRAFFQSIPVELEHAALIDGANRAQALWLRGDAAGPARASSPPRSSRSSWPGTTSCSRWS